MTGNRPRFAALLLAALGTLVLGGCVGGGGRLDKAEYEAKVRSVYAEVQAAFQRTAVSSPDELAGRVADAQEQLRDAADELESSEPPEAVEEENEEIVEGFREYADQLGRLRQAAEEGDSATVEAFRTVADREAVEQVAEAAEEMKFKGYDLGPIAEE